MVAPLVLNVPSTTGIFLNTQWESMFKSSCLLLSILLISLGSLLNHWLLLSPSGGHDDS